MTNPEPMGKAGPVALGDAAADVEGPEKVLLAKPCYDFILACTRLAEGVRRSAPDSPISLVVDQILSAQRDLRSAVQRKDIKDAIHGSIAIGGLALIVFLFATPHYQEDAVVEVPEGGDADVEEEAKETEA